MPLPTPGEWASLADRALTLLNRLDLGLDAFGYPSNYVSQLNRDLLDNEAQLRIDAATAVETAYNRYEDHAAGLQDQIDALKSSLNSTNDAINKKNGEAADAESAANAAQDIIAKLSDSVEDLRRQLLVADRDFRGAVETARPTVNSQRSSSSSAEPLRSSQAWNPATSLSPTQ